MNIFAFSPDTRLSALWLDDVRKNKMILETAQLLSTAIRFNDPFTELPVYKSAYMGHPCTKWTRESRANFHWLTNYMEELCKQKSGNHKSSSLIPYFRQYAKEGSFKSEDMTPHVNCARNKERGVDFSHVTDVHDAYRQYINARWTEKTIRLTWNWGVCPEWKE